MEAVKERTARWKGDEKSWSSLGRQRRRRQRRVRSVLMTVEIVLPRRVRLRPTPPSPPYPETLYRRVITTLTDVLNIRCPRAFTSVPPKPSGKSRHDNRVYTRLVRFEFIRFVPFVPSECTFWPVQKRGGEGSIEKLRHAFSDRQSPFFSL